MATCLEIIGDALRLARVIGIGKEPRGAEAEAGMRCLQSLYDGWVSNGMFGRLTDEYLDAGTAAQEGRRYCAPAGVTVTDATDSYEPVDSDYAGYGTVGYTGETRQPRDLAIYEVQHASGDRFVKLYDRDRWVEMTGLDLSDDAPLSGRGHMGLAACLAINGAFSAMFGTGQDVNPDVRGLAAQFIHDLSYRRGSTQDRAAGEYF